ncbi:hypothetical protein [Novacetimonas pomaceti]|uniref:hypothetical protein n=1 Tax=Novacetimonas pomaceti TaxID=2021998 RepID=UPI001C2DE493|nr:hypothetical protein [Novacetimonas pomaceti]MBV1835218.1 hypothetical protein [Novacetimonas pomaceti]
MPRDPGGLGMCKKDSRQPPGPPKAKGPPPGAHPIARQQREAQALRDNLRRRKQQMRARATPDTAPPSDGTPRT